MCSARRLREEQEDRLLSPPFKSPFKRRQIGGLMSCRFYAHFSKGVAEGRGFEGLPVGAVREPS